MERFRSGARSVGGTPLNREGQQFDMTQNESEIDDEMMTAREQLIRLCKPWRLFSRLN